MIKKDTINNETRSTSLLSHQLVSFWRLFVAVPLLIATIICVTFASSSAHTLSNSKPKGIVHHPAWETEVFSYSNYRLSSPNNIIALHGELWVLGYDGVSVINATNGQLIRVISGSKYEFDGPDSIAYFGGTIWISDLDGDTITKLNATNGALIDVVHGFKYNLKEPSGIAISGGNVWVTDSGSNHLTVFSASNGRVIRILSEMKYKMNGATSICSSGENVWISGYGHNSLLKFNGKSGNEVLSISDTRLGIPTPSSVVCTRSSLYASSSGGDIARLSMSGIGSISTRQGEFFTLGSVSGLFSDGSNLWLTSPEADAVAEIDAKTLDFEQIFFGTSFGLDRPFGICGSGKYLWVSNSWSNSLVRFGKL
jgi:outer membrane protein assembly factor BamB